MDKFILYTKSDCPYCEALKDIIKDNSNNMDIIEQHQVDERSERDILYKKWGLLGHKATMPQLFLIREDGHKERIGDSQESKDWIEVMYS